MRMTFFCLFAMVVWVNQAPGSNLNIDGVLDEVVYKQVEPLKSDTSEVYFVPTADMLILGFAVKDENISIANADEWWSGSSSVEMWIDWGNEKSGSPDENDEQFWFVPTEGNNGRGYVGMVENPTRRFDQRMFDYGSETDSIDMAFVINEGTGYTMEARIDKAELTEGYIAKGKIGFGYAAIIRQGDSFIISYEEVRTK